MRRLIAIVLLCVLTANVSHAHIIELHGDSTQTGFPGVPPQAVTFTPKKLLQSMLDQECGYGTHIVVDKSESGSSFADAFTRPFYSYGGLTFPQYVATSGADIIIANWGINDVFTSMDKWTFIWHHWMAGLYAQAAGKIFISETPNPLNYSTLHDAKLAEFATTLVAFAPSWPQGVIDQFTHVQTLPAWQFQLADGVHPSQLLYFHKVYRIFQFLKQGRYVC